MLHIVLIEPEIPQNTGNIARTCAATGSELHLVEPLGYKLEDKYLKRAGLDYWPLVKIHVHKDFGEVLERYRDASFYYASTKAPQSYAQVRYPEEAFLVFGRESRGLSEDLLRRVYDRCIRIPMVEGARSLNLSNSVAIVAYEALRQHDFRGMLDRGALTGRDEEPGAWSDYL
ncbi:MAG: tRNA (uridine(34)/cytosine(34)/5-carboxymethylaminomethyluridine(34)-2'-O)-methyltransferase TrmL [Clostridia bacterium]|nr:tRNA (uridine(34)/cytosine(34)/5-carboxymethylaminomethyluridine(34)-2'-O)-methyltransferase TrmL [Clostridia bacterium]